MFAKQTFTLTLAAFASFSLSPAFAQFIAEEGPASDAHIAPGGEPGPRAGQKHHGRHGMRAFQRVRNLSSLTDEQKQKIDGVMTAFRDEMRPLKQKAKALREQAENAGADEKASAAAQASLEELKPAIKEKSKAAWTQVKQILTAEQLKELKGGRPGPQSDTGLGTQSNSCVTN